MEERSLLVSKKKTQNKRKRLPNDETKIDHHFFFGGHPFLWATVRADQLPK